MVGGSLLGASVGNYVITSQLGQGGMGDVYLAEHPRIQRNVAVKVLAPHLTESQAERFLAEAQAVARIKHSNVVDIYDFGSLEDGRPYYVMEHLEGRELRALLEERCLTPEELLPYLQQICAGLQAAHDGGVIHRDLKPENIFVLDGEPLAVKILDFGIAKLTETNQDRVSLTATGAVMGTPLYIAPEQAEGKTASISHRTDLYSLGVVLYAALSGHPPFESDVAALLLTKHIQESAPPLQEAAPTVPLEVCRVVHHCLEKDPQARPGSAVEVAEAFAEALERPWMKAVPEVTTLGGAAIEVTGTNPPQPQQRSSLVFLGLGALTVAVLAITAYAMVGRGSTNTVNAARRPTAEQAVVPATPAAQVSSATRTPTAVQPTPDGALADTTATSPGQMARSKQVRNPRPRSASKTTKRIKSKARAPATERAAPAVPTSEVEVIR